MGAGFEVGKSLRLGLAGRFSLGASVLKDGDDSEAAGPVASCYPFRVFFVSFSL